MTDDTLTPEERKALRAFLSHLKTHYLSISVAMVGFLLLGVMAARNRLSSAWGIVGWGIVAMGILWLFIRRRRICPADTPRIDRLKEQLSGPLMAHNMALPLLCLLLQQMSHLPRVGSVAAPTASDVLAWVVTAALAATLCFVAMALGVYLIDGRSHAYARGLSDLFAAVTRGFSLHTDKPVRDLRFGPDDDPQAEKSDEGLPLAPLRTAALRYGFFALIVAFGATTVGVAAVPRAGVLVAALAFYAAIAATVVYYLRLIARWLRTEEDRP